MRANIFLKENGLKKCSRIVEDLIEQGHNGEFVKDLKRLVESHELVEKVGGLSIAKDFYKKFECVHVGLDLVSCRSLGKAIADVESCK